MTFLTTADRNQMATLYLAFENRGESDIFSADACGSKSESETSR